MNLPSTWTSAALQDVVELNPAKDLIDVDPAAPIAFVPMASAKEEFGGIDVTTTRPFEQVKKGYVQFRKRDVLFAKITPCMENGKLGVVPELGSPVGYGSTEFHVLRSPQEIDPRWIAHYLSQSTFRRLAKRYMSGSAGQLRVPETWLAQQPIPIAPSGEQGRIIAKIEELVTDLDAAMTALKRARANLKRYRSAVLKAAVEGRLTANWRAAHPEVEPAERLLERILVQRRRQWEKAQLTKFAEKRIPPPEGWKENYPEPVKAAVSDNIKIPAGWVCASLHQLCIAERPIAYGVLQPGSYVEGGVPLVRVGDVNEGNVDQGSLKRISPLIAAKFPRTKLQGGEILLTIVGTIGRTAVVPESLAGGTTARAVAVIPTLKILNPRFVEICLRERGMQSRLTRAAHEVARKTLNLEDVRPAAIPLPSLQEQKEIVSEVERMLSLCNRAAIEVEHSLLRSETLRQSVLKRAFEGELVRQDSSDEPASELLARIRAEQAAKDGRQAAAQSKRRREAKLV